MSSSHQSASLSLIFSACVSLHPSQTHTHTHTRSMHACTSSTYSSVQQLSHWHTRQPHQWVSGRRLPWQHIPSRAAAWSEVWCCWTSPLFPLLCIAACMLLYGNAKWYSPDTQMSTWKPQKPCYLEDYRTRQLISHAVCFFLPTMYNLYAPAMVKLWLVLCHVWGYEQHMVLSWM